MNMFSTVQEFFSELGIATWQTLYMVIVSTVVASVIGGVIGLFVTVTAKNGICPNRPVNAILEVIVNIGRSIPFIIMLILIIPFTRFIVGSALGTTAAIVPLTIAAIPFVARVVDSALKEIDSGVIEASQSMGSTNFQIVMKVMLPESLPSLLRGLSLTIINLVGYSAMAGTVGGGGLGFLAYDAYQKGYSKNFFVIMSAVVVLVLFVQLVQFLFNILVAHIDKKNR